MKNALWEAIHRSFRDVRELCDRAAAAREENRYQSFIDLRASIRGRLDTLRGRFAETLNEREVYCALFPIVIHFDELVLTRLVGKSPTEWPLLQKELFGIDNGGEIVFEMAEDLLRKPDSLPFLFEVLYFCVGRGLKGRHDQDPFRLSELQRKLRLRIPIPQLPERRSGPETDAVPAIRFPWWYYAATALLVAGSWSAFRWAAGS